MTFEHEGEIVALLGGRITQGDGAGDIGGAIDILASGIDKEEAVALDGNICFGSSLIVHDSAMLVPAEDRRETLIDTRWVGETESAEAFAEFYLGQLTLGVFAFHHHKETSESHAILLHSDGEVGDHGFILDALEFSDAFATEYYIAIDMVEDAACSLGGVDQEIGRCRQLCDKLLDGIVGESLEVILLEMRFDRVGKFLIVDEEDSILRVEEEETDKNGGEIDIVGGTEVGGPCQVVESRNEDSISTLEFDLMQHGIDLLIGRLTYDFLVVNEERIERASRAIGVYKIEQWEIGVESNALCREGILETAGIIDRESHAIDADGLTLSGMFYDPVDKVDSLGAILLHHFKAGIAELIFSLDEIS